MTGWRPRSEHLERDHGATPVAAEPDQSVTEATPFTGNYFHHALVPPVALRNATSPLEAD